MADIAPTELDRPDERTRVYQWSGLTEADEGAAVRIPPGVADKTLIATDTFNGGSYALECGADGQNFAPAVDAQGTAIAVTSAGSVLVASNALYWRIANDNGGSSEDVDLSLVCALAS